MITASTDLDSMTQRVQRAIEHFREGGMVIMVDDEDRENEGDLVTAADLITPEKVNFMAKEARGLVCLTLQSAIADRLRLPMMEDSTKAGAPLKTAFTVSIEARAGVTTGISAHDRAHTIKVAISPDTQPSDLVVPGHIFPVKARDGGVLERAGHTEGSVDLAKLAGRAPAAVICEIMRDDGSMARRDDLQEFAQRYDLPLISIEDLISYRLGQDYLVQEVARRELVTPNGVFQGVWFKYAIDNSVHFALVKGQPFAGQCVHVRVHKQQPLEDVFFGTDPATDVILGRSAIDYGLQMLEHNSRAVFLYLHNTAPDNLVLDSLKRAIDPRMNGIGAQILKTLGVSKMNLHVRSQRSHIGLGAFGLTIEQTIPMRNRSSPGSCGKVLT